MSMRRTTEPEHAADRTRLVVAGSVVKRREHFAIGYELRRDDGRPTHGPEATSAMAAEGRRAVDRALRSMLRAAKRIDPDHAEDIVVSFVAKGMPRAHPARWASTLPEWLRRLMIARWQRAGLLVQRTEQDAEIDSDE